MEQRKSTKPQSKRKKKTSCKSQVNLDLTAVPDATPGSSSPTTLSSS